MVEEGAPAMGAKSLCIPAEQPKKIVDQKISTIKNNYEFVYVYDLYMRI